MKDSELIKRRSFNAGEKIITKGDKDKGIYYIKSGLAENEESGITYGENCKLHYFGFLGSLSEERTSTIVAKTPVEALIIDIGIIDSSDYLYAIILEILRETFEIIKDKDLKINFLTEEIDKLKNEKKRTSDDFSKQIRRVYVYFKIIS